MNKGTGLNIWAIFVIASVLFVGVACFFYIKNLYLLGLIFLCLLLAVVLFFKLTSIEARENREFEKLMNTPIVSARSPQESNIDYLNELFKKRLMKMNLDGTEPQDAEPAPIPPVFSEPTIKEDSIKELKIELIKEITSLKIEILIEFAKIHKDTIFVDKKALK